MDGSKPKSCVIVNSNALYKCKDQLIGGWMDGQTDGWMAVNQNLALTIVNSNALYKCKDQLIGRMDGWTDRWMDGWQ